MRIFIVFKAAGLQYIACACVRFSITKFRASFGISDSTLLSVSASPVRLNTRPFKTLRAPPIWPNLDDRLRLLDRIS